MAIPALNQNENEFLEHFLTHCHKRRYKSKNEIIRPGDPADTLYYIVEGSVAVIIDDQDGREMVLTYLNAGDYIGGIGLFFNREKEARGVSVRTRTNCVLAEVSYQRLQQLFEGPLKEQQADVLYALGGQLGRRLMQTSRKVANLAFLDVTGRIAGTLLDLCKEPDAMTHPDGMQIRITRQEIGKIVGCSREMAGRVLKNLEQEGLLWVKGKTIVVFGTR